MEYFIHKGYAPSELGFLIAQADANAPVTSSELPYVWGRFSY